MTVRFYRACGVWWVNSDRADDAVVLNGDEALSVSESFARVFNRLKGGPKTETHVGESGVGGPDERGDGDEVVAGLYLTYSDFARHNCSPARLPGTDAAGQCVDWAYGH